MSRLRALALLLVLTPLVAACGGGSGNSGDSKASRASAATNDSPISLKRAYAKLTHAPSGGITLTWRPDDRSLLITLDLSGFVPHSVHPAHIHSGRCEAGGPVQIDLGVLTADGQGRIAGTLTQTGSGGVPPHGWYLDIHNAVGDDPYALLAPACVNLDSADQDASHQQVIHASVTAGVGASMNVAGEATFEIEDSTLVVVATLRGLEPYSAHPLFIMAGDCAHLGARVFSFYLAQADSDGRAKIKQQFDGVATIPPGWSLLVVRGVHLQSPVDAAPIACGAMTAAP